MTAKKANLPPRSDSVTVITKAQPRNSTVSPERLQLEAFLKSCRVPIRTIQIADKTGFLPDFVRKMMWRLVHDGIATNVGGRCGKLLALGGSGHVARIDPKSYHCGGTMPYARAGDIPRMECVR